MRIPISAFASFFRLFSALRSFHNSSHFPLGGIGNINPAPSLFEARWVEQTVHRLRPAIERAVQATRELGAKPLLVTHPLRIVRDDNGQLGSEKAQIAQHLGVSPDDTVAAFNLYNRLVVDLGRKERVPVAHVATAVEPGEA